MYSLSKKQKDSVVYFQQATHIEETRSIEYLKKANWEVDKACDLYFSDQTPKVPKATKKQEEIYAKYKDIEKNSDKIEIDGIQEFLKDINVDPLDPTTLAFSYLCKAKTMGKYSRDEFCLGLACLKQLDLKNLKLLGSQKKDSDITFDTWKMLLEFHYQTKGNLNNFVDDGAWPTIVDEFVEFLKKN